MPLIRIGKLGNGYRVERIDAVEVVGEDDDHASVHVLGPGAGLPIFIDCATLRNAIETKDNIIDQVNRAETDPQSVAPIGGP